MKKIVTKTSTKKIDPKWIAEQMGAEIVPEAELSPRLQAIVKGGDPRATWALQRLVNCDRILADAREDDSCLFRAVCAALEDYAKIPRDLGDDAGADYVCKLAVLVSNKIKAVPR